MSMTLKMEEADLYNVAILNTRDTYLEQMKGWSVIEINSTTNAYAGGFYMAARYVEKPRHPFDWIPTWFPLPKKQRPIRKVERLKAWAADQYIKVHFLGMSPANQEEVRTAVMLGFIAGAKFMEAKIK
jgi:hypothetical protein